MEFVTGTAVEYETPVDLEEREVGADEDRMVGRVLDVDLDHAPPGIQDMVPSPRRYSPGLMPASLARADGSLNMQHAHAVPEQTLDLDRPDQLGHPLKHVVLGQGALANFDDLFIGGAAER
jgi:hypothetical protein